MNEILTKQEIADILNVKIGSIRMIESRDKLYDKLHEKGYELISKEKNGRTYNYTVKHFSENKESLNNCMSTIFNSTNNEKKQCEYILYRYNNLKYPLSRKFLGKLTNTSENTIARWDDKMIEQRLFQKDGFFYIAIDYEDSEDEGEYRITGIDEYNTFVKNNKYLKIRNKALNDNSDGRLTNDECAIIISETEDRLKANYGKIVYKIRKVAVGKNKILLDIVIDLIHKVYGNYDYKYIQNWLDN